jgi:hypothetical protein
MEDLGGGLWSLPKHIHTTAKFLPKPFIPRRPSFNSRPRSKYNILIAQLSQRRTAKEVVDDTAEAHSSLVHGVRYYELWSSKTNQK